MIPRRVAITWLQVVLVGVLVYSLALVFAGRTAGNLFSWLGFGPGESIDTSKVRDYLKLPFMVLGAVMAGWSVLMIQLVRGPLREGSRWAWLFMVQSLVLWFVLDTGMSIVLGYPTHALFNIPFAVALGVPLLSLRSTASCYLQARFRSVTAPPLARTRSFGVIGNTSIHVPAAAHTSSYCSRSGSTNTCNCVL